MSRQIGLDLSPFALRAWSLAETGEMHALATVYSPKGCTASQEYESEERWDDPLAFRGRSFNSCFEVNNVEQTVEYRKPDASSVEWLKDYAQRIAAEQGATYGSRLVATIPDHATPDEKDNVLRGLGMAGFGKSLLLWRPVAAALHWLGQQPNNAVAFEGHHLLVVDLDGPAPEVTEFDLVRHEKQTDYVVPVRKQPKRHQVLKTKGFHDLCYHLVMNGFPESMQLMEGQFSAETQTSLESGESGKDLWIRRKAAWTRVHVDFAADLPDGILKKLGTIFRKYSSAENTHVVCVGWLARRYPRQISEGLKTYVATDVEVLPAEAVSAGAARFGDLLAKGHPTYYDKLPCYRWWDSRAAEWVKLFDKYQRVEPGADYVYPAEGSPPCKLKIDRYNDNVSMYVQVMTEDDKYEEDDVYAHRLRLNFAEFLRVPQVVTLTARVNPQEGSASFTITADIPIFKIGNNRSCTATLRYSEDPDANRYSSVRVVHEHEGYLEPQPVLGRIYDSDAYVHMAELHVRDQRSNEYEKLKEKYFNECNGPDRFLSGRIGYSPRKEISQPTRGLFGSVRVPDVRIDAVAKRFAECEGAKYWYYNNQHSYDWYTAQNYCFSWATQEYKDQIRKIFRKNLKPNPYSAYLSPAYVLGDDPEDLSLVIGYFKNNSFYERSVGFQRYENIWWGVFRMLCWHPEIKFRIEDRCLVKDFVDRSARACKWAKEKGLFISELGKQSLLYSLLFMMRVREDGWVLPAEVVASAVNLVTTYLQGVRFPMTMVNNMNGSRQKPGDDLTKYILRFLQMQDDLQDRELGAAMGGV